MADGEHGKIVVTETRAPGRNGSTVTTEVANTTDSTGKPISLTKVTTDHVFGVKDESYTLTCDTKTQLSEPRPYGAPIDGQSPPSLSRAAAAINTLRAQQHTWFQNLVNVISPGPVHVDVPEATKNPIIAACDSLREAIKLHRRAQKGVLALDNHGNPATYVRNEEPDLEGHREFVRWEKNKARASTPVANRDRTPSGR